MTTPIPADHIPIANGNYITVLHTFQHATLQNRKMHSECTCVYTYDQLFALDAALDEYMSDYRYLWRRANYACKICNAFPDEEGEVQHGRGCFVNDDQGSAVTYEDVNNYPEIREDDPRHDGVGAVIPVMEQKQAYTALLALLQSAKCSDTHSFDFITYEEAQLLEEELTDLIQCKILDWREQRHLI